MRLNRRLRGAAIAISIAVFAGLTASPRTASAHPLGNFSVNHYNRIEASPAGVRVLYVVDEAEIPTFQLKQRIDLNHDGQVDAVEQQAYLAERVAELTQGISLAVNGQPVALTLTARSPVMAFSPGQGGLDTLRVSFWLDASVSPLGQLGQSPTSFEFRNANDPGRLGWREIVLRASDGVKISAANVSDKDVSDELRNYPQDLLNSPLKQTTATFEAVASAGAGRVDSNATTSQAAVDSASSSASANRFAALINYRDLTPSVILLSLLTALGLGALHALEPGHGKSVAAAYLVGARATPLHAVLLGSTVTITHTSSVFLMGLVTLFLSSVIVPEKLFPYLGLFSAGIVLVMGASMIVNAIRNRHAGLAGVATDHTHTFDPNTNQLEHTHGGKRHSHTPPSRLNARNVLAVGVSGGLVPCPAALIVLLSAIALGRVGFGMLLIVAFSIGLAGVLTAISLAVLYGKRALGRSPMGAQFAALIPQGGRLAMAMPMLSGLLVIGAGVLLLYYALPFLQIR